MTMHNSHKRRLANQMMTRPLPLYDDNFPIIFFWNPKCGCTSLIKWFFYQNGLLQTAKDYDEIIHTYRIKVFEQQKNHTNKIRKHLLNGTKDVYKLVRNPYTRAVSSYFHTLRTPRILNRLAPGMDQGLSFKQFLYRVRNKGVERGNIDGHMIQQYLDGEEMFIKNVIQLEEFTPSIKKIEKTYQLNPSPLDEIIRSPHHVTEKMNSRDNRNFANMRLTSMSFYQSLPPYENFYDQDTMNLVRTIYQKDFIQYGYDQRKI
ncbi:sulfotransferase family 2 domain-containing protein [Pseudalkalibacillus sp. SCS-8]|uniref:sulfotransferase family 2 domain-containing protein n=1 Tax=Pseudalkalibacillus nanhaiensis TaxID=3115291 RepID=UPI0032DAD040